MAEPVIIVDYDPRWPDVFHELSTRVSDVLEDVALTVAHVGSTSVVGLAAKPIIDMDVVVRCEADVARAIELLARLGYNHIGNQGIPGREAFSTPSGLPDHHLYICVESSEEYRRHIAFRDYLRDNLDALTEYAALKRALAERYRDDREAYTEGKSEYIEAVLRRAIDQKHK